VCSRATRFVAVPRPPRRTGPLAGGGRRSTARLRPTNHHAWGEFLQRGRESCAKAARPVTKSLHVEARDRPGRAALNTTYPPEITTMAAFLNSPRVESRLQHCKLDQGCGQGSPMAMAGEPAKERSTDRRINLSAALNFLSLLEQGIICQKKDTKPLPSLCQTDGRVSIQMPTPILGMTTGGRGSLVVAPALPTEPSRQILRHEPSEQKQASWRRWERIL